MTKRSEKSTTNAENTLIDNQSLTTQKSTACLQNAALFINNQTKSHES